ncbi:2-dehydro-3-deoxygalactonokinase [Vibrio sp. S9_S30]|uniref:2-dehydro-3-deoxygalactonokinase n=1 Tax=Vibrio sp. S9_S30 TaxID=2720226 RepID=UPI001680043D|nr:2-dehydro-3-deoxygalactonokinase [Vibrio sp. S9_S30]MBD1557560.1 2-dehydro-3-deoxygalactonokinase [Vibrio sp. S9_S30]
MKGNWIAVDWGTTNFRAFLMSESGECLDSIRAKKGLLSIKPNQFSAEFDHLIDRWITESDPLPVLMAGMVGSQQGWCEVPYASAPASVNEIVRGIKTVPLLSGAIGKIIPGIRCQNAFGYPDVMRGEEVQLIGLSELLSQDFSAILYGTHSKHAHWKNGKLIQFSTVMTGELYSILVEHSLLGKALPKQTNNNDVFYKGMDMGISNPLNHILFSARTFRLTNKIKQEHVHAFISGLLIGHELSLVNKDNKLYLIGSNHLSQPYSDALSHLNIKHQRMDGDQCFLKGMTKIYKSGNNHEY